jgi:cytochrome c oxidase assembly factor CtaG
MWTLGLLVAHLGHHDLSSELWRWWSFDPLVVLALALSAWLYGRGVRRLWRRAGVDRGIRRWQALSFLGGWLALFIALVSPLDTLGAVLFSAHMVQHEVLMLLAAPLMVLGQPLLAFLWALPRAGRERVAHSLQNPALGRAWGALTHPLVVFLLHGLAIWIWHLPSLYQATLGSDFVHALQHLSFFGTAALFWWALVHGRYGRLGYGVAVLYVFLTGLHSGVLGALLTFAPRLWYPIYAARAARWGLAPLEDQQLAGLLMWIPAGVVFIVFGLAHFAAWVGVSERRVVAHERERLHSPR